MPDTTISFDVDAKGICNSLYYRFSVHPDYGTSGYDGTNWSSMTTTEWVSNALISYKFDKTAKYIVVVWAADSVSNSVSQGIPIAGLSLDLGSDSCRTNFTGYDIEGELKTDMPVKFTVKAENSCSTSLYYRFSIHPDYGTSNYDGTNWSSMTTTEWVTDTSVDHVFSKSGRYIIVVWATVDTGDVDNTDIPVIGWAVDVE